jgi:hypothetical protein
MFGVVALCGAGCAFTGDIEQCQLLEVHSEATACLEQASAAKQTQLSVAEDKFRGVLKQWDEKGSYRDTAIRTFNIAALGFEKHQKEICNFEIAAASGKNSAADVAAKCRYRTASERVEMLEEQLKLFVP